MLNSSSKKRQFGDTTAMTSKMTPLVCLLSGAAGLFFLCASHASSAAARATAACEAELKKGAEQLAEGKFDDALVAFQAALKTLGWAEAGPRDKPRLSLLRNALLCQALTGAARAALLAGRSLEDACAFAEHALSAAQLCGSGAQRALLPVAERTMLDVLLAQSAAHARDAKWQDARSAATSASLRHTSASRHAVDEEAEALVRAALKTARSGEFKELVAASAASLQRRAWQNAEIHAEQAQRLAEGTAEKGEVDRLRREAKQGLFDQLIAVARTYLQQRSFKAAERAVSEAQRAAFDAATNEQVSVARAEARQGLHEAALNEVAVAAAAKDWDRVIDALNRARSHAATEAQRAAADACLTQARSAKFCSVMDAAQAHLSAGRWEHAEAYANCARHCADRAMDVNAVRAVARLLHSVSAQRDAAEKAEPEYINAVDDFIRRRPDFSGDAPTQYACMVSLIAKNCPKPAAIPHEDVVTVLRRHADVFTVAPGGATVRLVRLTPWRGDEGHRVFGELRCTKCNKRWRSAATYCDKKQACQKCQVWVYPYAQRPLDCKVASEDDEDNERRPHDMANCQKCRELGRCCVPMSSEATRNGQGGMYRGGGRGRGGGGRGGHGGGRSHTTGSHTTDGGGYDGSDDYRSYGDCY